MHAMILTPWALLAALLAFGLWWRHRQERARAAQVHTEDERLASERRLRRIDQAVENAGVAIGVGDIAGRAFHHNRAHRELLGYTPAELNAASGTGALFADPAAAREIHDHLRQGRPWRGETELCTRDGRRVPAYVRADGIPGDRGQPAGVVFVLRDITRERRAAAEAERARKLESLGVLAGGIAHDFRNLLTALIGNLTLAQRAPGVPDPALARLNEVERAAWRAQDLTQQLLTFAKGGAPVKKPVALPALIREAVGFALHGAPVAADFALAEELWPVEADEGQLSQVINNLALNAVQAMPRGGRLRVAAANLPPGRDTLTPWLAVPMVKLSLTDEGAGISPEHLARIFDPFFTTKPNSTGLGLATAYSIVKKHDGHLQVESVVGRGTTFHVYLPALPTAVPPSPAVVEPAVPAEAPAPDGAAARILLMDDQHALRETVGRMLALIGYTVETAGDGAEALRVYRQAQDRQRPFAAVIFDLHVPGGMGGAEAVKRLRALDPQAKAIVASGYSDDPVIAHHRACGFDAALAKPFKMADLKRVLGEVLAA